MTMFGAKMSNLDYAKQKKKKKKKKIGNPTNQEN